MLTGDELGDAIATINAALAGKQDAATAATDAELATAVATINAAIALKQNASTAATDAELALHIGDTTFVHGIADTTLVALTTDSRFPSAGQKAALVGTDGTPGSGNKYVTNSDARNTNARAPTAHAHPTSDVTGLDAALTAKQDAATAATDAELASGLAGKSDLGHTHAESEVTGLVSDLAAKQETSEKGQPDGYAALDGDGLVPTGQIPALALVNVFVVASEAAQLALVAEGGDVAVRSDETKSYIHNGGTAGSMADWTLLQTPGSAVLSVNGQTGVVSLTYTDVGAAAASHTHTASQVTDFDTQVRTSRLDQMAVPTSALSANSQRVTNLAAPSSANDAARKVYVDDGLALKQDAATAATDSELATGLATKADASHSHPESDVTGLVSDLAGKQPLDSDLTAIAALSTTSFGRGLLALADQAALLSAAGAQAADSDLTAIAALSTTSYGRGLLTLADQAALLAATGAQASDSDLTAIAALATTSFGRSLLTLADQPALLSAAGAAAASHGHVQSDVTGLVAALAAKMDDGEAAGGVLSGTYPNPGFAADMATQAELNAHEADTTSVHGIADTSVLATATSVATAVSNHEADTTAVHGIANTANLILEGDARLSDARTPSGTAGGVLSGSFPNPGFAVDMATQAELDAVASGVARFASLDKLAVA